MLFSMCDTVHQKAPLRVRSEIWHRPEKHGERDCDQNTLKNTEKYLKHSYTKKYNVPSFEKIVHSTSLHIVLYSGARASFLVPAVLVM